MNAIADRFRCWKLGDIQGLFSDVLQANQTLELVAHSQSSVSAARTGNFGKACKFLLSDGISEVNESVVSDHRSKHPPRFEPIVIESETLSGSIQVTPAEVLKALSHFPRGSGAGPSKLSPQHLLEAVQCLSPARANRSLTALCDLVNLLAKGDAPLDLANYFCGANLIPLKKKLGGSDQLLLGKRSAALFQNISILP